MGDEVIGDAEAPGGDDTSQLDLRRSENVKLGELFRGLVARRSGEMLHPALGSRGSRTKLSKLKNTCAVRGVI